MWYSWRPGYHEGCYCYTPRNSQWPPLGGLLELQPDLRGERSTSGLVGDLSERARIDIQVRACRCRVIEEVASIHTERNASRFTNPDRFLNIGIEIPAAGPINGIQAQRAQLAGAAF